MKKKLAYTTCLIGLYALLSTGCQKQLVEQLDFKTGKPAQQLANKTNKCRLVAFVSEDFFSGLGEYYTFNEQGLVATYSVDLYGLLATNHYDDKGRLISGSISASYGNFDVFFEYSNNHISREIWYIAGTDVVDDTVQNIYNVKGQLIKRVSTNYGLIINLAYDENGNNIFNEALDSEGGLVQRAFFTFGKAIKNPETTLPGLPDYNYIYLNNPINKWRHTSSTLYFPDADGNPELVYAQDPSLSTLVAGDQNYAASQVFYDATNDLMIHSSWTMENCGGKAPVNSGKPAVSQAAGSKRPLQLSDRLSPLLKKNASTLIKENQLLRQQLKKSK